MSQLHPNEDQLISYKSLRLFVGLLGVLMPVVLILFSALTGNTPVNSSISAYYYGDTRDMFVGGLWAIGVFLICYWGRGPADPSRWFNDVIVSRIAGFAIIGVSLIPTTTHDMDAYCAPEPVMRSADFLIWQFELLGCAMGHVHFALAASFLICTALFSLFLFTGSARAGGQQTAIRRWRHRLYITCGIIIVLALLATGLAVIIGWHETTKIVFWLESIAVVAFGISWIVKGEAAGLLADRS